MSSQAKANRYSLGCQATVNVGVEHVTSQICSPVSTIAYNQFAMYSNLILLHVLHTIIVPMNPFQPCVALHIETNHLIWTANQMTGFYMKGNTGLKLVTLIGYLLVKRYSLSRKLGFPSRHLPTQS